MRVNKELLKGSTSLLVLSLLKVEDMYGYQMIKRLKEKSENVFEFQEGTLYPILHSLEEKNYISSYWDNTGPKKRKYYSITKSGMQQLQQSKKEWQTFSNGINLVVGGALFEY